MGKLISSPLLDRQVYLADADLQLAYEFNHWPLEVKATVFKIGYAEALELKDRWERIIFDGFLERISKRYTCRYEGGRVSLPEMVKNLDFGISWETIRKQAKSRRLSPEIMNEIDALIENDLMEGGSNG